MQRIINKRTEMRKTTYLLFAVAVCALFFAACDSEESYSDKLKRERAAISQFITDRGIKVISEEEFAAAGNKTDLTKNEYVLFNSSGVYMQILSEGTGEKLYDGESATVLCRFEEFDIEDDTLTLTNKIPYYVAWPEKMTVTRSNSKFYATFDSSSSLIYSSYGSGSTSVPSGWLTPFTYIKLGRQTSESDSIAHVRLIVPSEQGHAYAINYVYPCYYDITYQRGR